MFTGIIEEIGQITQIIPIAGGKQLTISASKILSDLQVNDSVSVSGVCLTAVAKGQKSFQVEAVGDTLEKTTIKNVRSGDEVNLERSLRIDSRLGGHFVQGHVNGLGIINHFKQIGENWDLQIELPAALMNYVITEGSIAIDGVSLTIAEVWQNNIRISVIPHTYKNTIMRSYYPGRRINIETDFLGKYVEKFVNTKTGISKISQEWLKNLGY